MFDALIETAPIAAATPNSVAIEGIADIGENLAACRNDANDPKRSSASISCCSGEGGFSLCGLPEITSRRTSGALGRFHGRVAGDEVAVIGDVIGEERAETLDVVAPIAVQLTRKAEPGHKLSSGLRHPIPR